MNIKDKLTSYSLRHTFIETISRGRMYCNDRLMRGTLRFATKIGDNPQLFAPMTGNTTLRVHDVGENALDIAYRPIVPAGATIKIYDYYYIAELFEENPAQAGELKTATLYVSPPLKEEIPSQTFVTLASVPITVRGNYNVGDTRVVINSTVYPIYPLDEVQLGNYLYYVLESNAVSGGYDCLLASGLSETLRDGQASHLLASPHFQSGSVYLDRYGPSLFDFFGGTHLLDIDIVLAGEINFYGADGSLIDSIFYRNSRREAIFNLYASITPEMMALGTFVSPCDLADNYFIINPRNGYGGFQLECTPALPNEQVTEWIMRVKADDSDTVIIFHPFPGDDNYEYSLSGNWQDIRLPGPASLTTPIKELRFSIRGNSPVKIAFITPNRVASYITYSMVIKSIPVFPPNYAYLSTGILSKPLFIDLRETDAYADLAELDTGFTLL